MTDDEKDFILCPECGAPIAIRIVHSLYVHSFRGACECGWVVSGHKVHTTGEPIPLSKAAKKRAKREKPRAGEEP